MLTACFVRRPLEHNRPVSAAVFGEFGLENLGAGHGEVVGGPDLYFLAVFLKPARISPNLPGNDYRTVEGLRAWAGHAADGVVSVLGVVRVDGKLNALTIGFSDLLLAKQEIGLGRPPAFDVGADLPRLAERGVKERTLTLPFAEKNVQLPGGIVLGDSQRATG